MTKQIDLHALDARIEKLRRLREILQDDETRELADQILSGTNSTAQAAPVVTPRRPKTAKKGQLLKKVFETAKGQAQNFTIKTILDAMTESGFHFQAANPTIAVGGVIRKLAKRGKLRIVEEGAGSKGSLYAVI
jgi:hypothetical protein